MFIKVKETQYFVRFFFCCAVLYMSPFFTLDLRLVSKCCLSTISATVLAAKAPAGAFRLTVQLLCSSLRAEKMVINSIKNVPKSENADFHPGSFHLKIIFCSSGPCTTVTAHNNPTRDSLTTFIQEKKVATLLIKCN